MSASLQAASQVGPKFWHIVKDMAGATLMQLPPPAHSGAAVDRNGNAAEAERTPRSLRKRVTATFRNMQPKVLSPSPSPSWCCSMRWHESEPPLQCRPLEHTAALTPSALPDCRL